MEYILTTISILFLVNIVLSIRLLRHKVLNEIKLPNLPAPQVHVNLEPLQSAINELPNKVLQSIVSSTNTHKGAVGELIGYLQLQAQYDRIVPLGNIVDFVCIKFDKKIDDLNTENGSIDFIDIKTGDKARLSKDQRSFQKLIQEKRINFIKLKIEAANLEN